MSKQTAFRILWGVTMAASAAAYSFLVPDLLRFPFQTWNWPMLAALLLAEFEIFEGIDYFISGRAFRKPKLCKRMNTVCVGIIAVGLLLMLLDAAWHFIEPDLIGLYFLMFFALCLILLGHGLNCFFDSLRYFLHGENKKWFKTAWNVAKMAAVVLAMLCAVLWIVFAL